MQTIVNGWSGSEMQCTSLKYCLGATLLIGLSCWSVLFAQGPQKSTPPRAIHTVDPKYSADALRVAKDKVILVTVTVPPDGIPTNVKIAKAVRPDVDKAVVDAVQKWRFEPATRDGKPIEATITVQVDFHLYR
jgi:TonB family protein